jgi:hypothetical protein
MPELISTLIANLLNSQWFYIIAGIWALASIANKKERDLLTDRLGDIISKPPIFEVDENPNSVPFYPRQAFEQISKAVASALVRIPKEINTALLKLIDIQFTYVVNPERRWKVLGYAIHFLFFFFFVWADGIAIINALDALGLIGGIIWEPLTRYELAVAFGSFFAIIVAAMVARELYSEKSDLSDWDEQKGFWKQIAKGLTLILIVSGLIVVVALGLGRYEGLGLVPLEWVETIRTFVNSTTLILVPLNTVLATLLIYHEAIKAILLVFVIVEYLIVFFVKIWEYIAEILAGMGPFTVDVVYKFMLGIVLIVFFFLLTPLDFLTSLLPQKK